MKGKNSYMEKRKIISQNGNNMHVFKNANRAMCMGLYGEFNEPDERQYYFDDYIGTNKQGRKELYRCLTTPGQKTLVKAPTGSGKTKTI